MNTRHELMRMSMTTIDYTAWAGRSTWSAVEAAHLICFQNPDKPTGDISTRVRKLMTVAGKYGAFALIGADKDELASYCASPATFLAWANLSGIDVPGDLAKAIAETGEAPDLGALQEAKNLMRAVLDMFQAGAAH